MQFDDGSPVARGTLGRTEKVETVGTYRAPANGAPEPVSLPPFLAQEVYLNTILGRDARLRLRGFAIDADVNDTEDGVVWTANHTQPAAILAAVNDWGSSLVGTLVVPGSDGTQPRDATGFVLGSIVDDDPTRRRESIEVDEKKLALRKANRLIKDAKEINPGNLAIAALTGGDATLMSKIVAELKSILALAGREVFKEVLRRAPAWLRFLLG